MLYRLSYFRKLLRLPSIGAPDTNQRSVCGGESGGTSRFDERETLSPCDLVAERVGADGFEPPKLKSSRFTVCPIWPLWNTPSSEQACETETRSARLTRRCSSS